MILFTRFNEFLLEVLCEVTFLNGVFLLQESDARASEHTVSENLEAPAREDDTPAKDIGGQMTTQQVCWQRFGLETSQQQFQAT